MCTGEIYIRMIRCLYKKYLIRKGREFEESRFAAVMALIGKLALKTLLSGKPLFKRTDVIHEIGDDAFDYGLLIGHEDFRLIRDETADILIAFAHRSIQEFLGSFCFIQKLTDGSSIESLLGVDSQEPIFMVNPLFLHFCLWLLYCSEKYVSFQNKEIACETLKFFVRARIDCTQLHISDIVRLYPAIDFERAVNEDDKLSCHFFGSVLCTIDKMKSLTLRTEDPLEWLLAHLNLEFTNLTLVKVCSKMYKSVFQGITFDGLFQETLTMTLPQFTTSDYCNRYLNIILTDEIYRCGMLKEVLKHWSFSKRRPAVYLYLQDGERTDLSNLLHENVHKAHVLSTQPANVTLTREVMRCPNLSHLSIVGRLTLDKRVFPELDKAVRSGNLPKISHLSLAGAKFVDSQLDFRILSQWSFLRYLNLFGCELSDKDTQALSLLNTTSLVISGCRILRGLPNEISRIPSQIFLSSLSTYELIGMDHLELIEVVGQCLLINLTELNLSMAPGEKCCLRDLKPNVIPLLEILRLERCITSLDDLQHLSVIVNSWRLRVLDISHSSGMSRHLSVLMQQSFPFLHTLVLSDCGLHSDDLSSLAEAKVNDRLPQLQHLNISHNIHDLDCLFNFDSKWENLVSLNIRNDTGLLDCLNVLQRYVESGCLYSLKTLRFYLDAAMKFRPGEMCTLWPNLTTLEIVSALNDIEYALTYARDAIKDKCFPSLRTVCVPVKPKVTSELKTDEHGCDWSDMSCVRHTPPNYWSQKQNTHTDDKKFAEAMHELKSLGVEVHVWFSGDEQFTGRAGVM